NDVPLAAGSAASEDHLCRKPAGMCDADPVQRGSHCQPRLRLRAETGGLVRRLSYLDTIIFREEEHLASRQHRPAAGTRDMLRAAVGQEQVALSVDYERGGDETVVAGTLAGATDPGEEVGGGLDPLAGGAGGDAGLDLGGADVGVEAGHGINGLVASSPHA